VDSAEFIDYIDAYIEASVDYILHHMNRSGFYHGFRNDRLWNALYDEIGHFLMRTYEQQLVEDIFAAGDTMCWAFGYSDTVEGWCWIRGDVSSVQREEGPICQALSNAGMSVTDFYDRFPKNHWVEIWYGANTLKLIKHEEKHITLALPSYIEARIELLQHTLNEYYVKDYQDEREVEAANAAGMVVTIYQKTNLHPTNGKFIHRYTCQIEQPRGSLLFTSKKFPSRSLDELVLMMCYDFADFEQFFIRNRFVERFGPIGGQSHRGEWRTLMQAYQEATTRSMTRGSNSSSKV
jgi:hypothetical protein